MRILAIRGRNLASLADAFEIDFSAEPLAGSGIFAITGPTGAGKSTLLDAVCLALFNEIPRLRAAPSSGRIGESDDTALSLKDTRAILRHGAGEAFAEVDFAMPDGGGYRARWSVKRARGRSDGRVQNYEHAFERLDTNERMGGTRTETLQAIRDVIGLSAEQFGRAVLLAQGDFEAFIRANADERALLLERLTGSEIYATLGRLAYEKAGALKAELDAIRDQIARQNGLDDVQRAEAEANAVQAHAEEAEANAAQTALQAARQWVEQADRLAQQVERAREGIATAEEANAAAALRREALVRDRRAFGLTTDWNELSRAERRKDEVASEVERAASSLSAARAAEEQAQLAEAEAAQAFTLVQSEAAALAPDLALARELDVKLAEAARVASEAQADSAAAQDHREAAEAQRRQAEHELAAAQTALAYESEWLAQNSALAVLVQREEELALCLADHSRIGAALSYDEAARPNLELAQQEALSKLEVAQENLQRATEDHQAAAAALAQAEEKRPAATLLAALTTRRDQIGTIERLLSEQQNSAETVLAAELAQAGIDERIAANDLNRRRLEAQAADLSQQVPALAVRADGARRELALLRAAADDAAVALRATLAEGAPCPVCGSAEHQLDLFEGKLGEHLREREAAARAFEAEHANAERNALSVAAEQGALADAATHLQRDKSAQAEQVNLAKERAAGANAALMEAAAALGLLKDVETLPAALSLQREQVDAEFETLTTSMAATESARQEEREARLAMEQAQETHDGARSLVDGCNRELEELDRLIAANSAENNRLEAALDRSLSPAGDWRAQPDGRTWLAGRAGDWREHQAKYDRLAVALPALQSAAAKAEEASNQCASQAADRAERADAAARNHTGLLAQRKAVLGGEPVATVEHRLATARAAAETARKNATTAREQNANARVAAEANHTARTRTSAEAEADHAARHENFTRALTKASLELEDVARVAAEGLQALEAEGQALAELEQAVGNARAVLLQREGDLAAHLEGEPPALTGSELADALQVAFDACEEAARKRSEAELVLRLDDVVRDRTAALRAELETKSTAADVWLRLNEVIGDRTGAVFRRFSQGLTLERLLDHANARLAELKPRYTLERASDGDMLIQVLDNDMGGEVRGLHNLSGGERFLVSLSLALGLAEMSTASGVKIESLFIDEGFGALDPASLGQAIALLEHLHATGRRVGVISHVEELKERIPVKIEVTPTGRGTSRLEVVGG